jgi:hypothetical protein
MAVFSFPEETEGAEAGRVLKGVLGVNPRPDNDIARNLERYSELVYNEDWDDMEARKLRQELGDHYGNSEPLLQELDLHIENSKWERGP